MIIPLEHLNIMNRGKVQSHDRIVRMSPCLPIGLPDETTYVRLNRYRTYRIEPGSAKLVEAGSVRGD